MDLRQFVERYGIAVGVVVALVATIALLPGNADDRLAAGNPATDIDLGVGDGLGGGDFGTDSVGIGAATGTPGVVGAGGPSRSTGSPASGGVRTSGTNLGGAPSATTGDVEFGTGPDCDANGKQKGIAYLMPPCVRWAVGDNGGATFRGVTGDQIKVVRWLGQLDPATQAILQGAQLSDGRAKIAQTYEAHRRYSNNHYQTYGREVVYIEMEAGGPSENDEAMRADAQRIAKEIKPFAVVSGDPAAPIPTVLARELAQLGIACICTSSLSQEFYTELPPLIYSTLPTATEGAVASAEYIAKKLWNKNATFAGDEEFPGQTFRQQTRKFGLIYIEGGSGRVDPEGKRFRDAFVREFAKYGMKFAAEVGYIYDPGRNQADVTNMIATMRNAGVTTIVPFWDPFYPILITQEATRQQYFPEWFITGTALSDTTTGGRLYDQRQWNRAFGVSPLWVSWAEVPKSNGYREYEHGDPDNELGDPGVLVNVYNAYPQVLFRGIHMAGPALTNETYARGMFAYPRTGGQPRAPLRYFTREAPTEIKDWVEVYYDSDEQGPDEKGAVGFGMVMRLAGGRRFELGQFTTEPSLAFHREGAISVSDDPALGGDTYDHETDGHRHDSRCLSCT